MYVTHLTNRVVFTESEIPDKSGFVHIITSAQDGKMVTEIGTYLYSAKHGHGTREFIRHPHSHLPLIAFRLHHEHVKATRQELLHVEKLPYWAHVTLGLAAQAKAAYLSAWWKVSCAFRVRSPDQDF